MYFVLVNHNRSCRSLQRLHGHPPLSFIVFLRVAPVVGCNIHCRTKLFYGLGLGLAKG